MSEPKPKTVDVILTFIDWDRHDNAYYGLEFQRTVDGNRTQVLSVGPNIVINNGQRPQVGWLIKSISPFNYSVNKLCQENPTLEKVEGYFNKNNYTFGTEPNLTRFTFEIPAENEAVASASSNSGKDEGDINIIQSPSNVMGSVDISNAPASGGGGGSSNVVSIPSSANPDRTSEELAADWKSRKPALGITIDPTRVDL